MYHVAGLFQRNDTQTNAGPVSVEVAIVENGSTVLFDQVGFTTYGSQETFDLGALSLTAGSTLDFAEIPNVPHNDSTGLAATITYVGALGTPTINVSATVPKITANGGTPGVFTMTRTGDSSQPLVVSYTVKGTAQAGVDYVLLKGTKKFMAGKSSVQIKVKPIAEDNPAAKKTVKFALAPGSGYVLGEATAAKVKIVSE